MNGSKALEAPPVELIQFVDPAKSIKNNQTCLRHLSQKYAFTRMTLILSTKLLSKIMWSACLNRSVFDFRARWIRGKQSAFISETRMESILRDDATVIKRTPNRNFVGGTSMETIYEKYMALPIDKGLLCLEYGDIAEPYFCYPVNAKPIGF